METEPLPGVFDPFEALKPGAPLVFGDDNVIRAYKIRKGETQAAFARADVAVENSYKTQVQEQAFLEPEAGIAWIDERDVVNIRVSTQVIEHFRSVADALGVPHNRVQIKSMFVGGGFGGKENITVELYLALLARATRRPVRLVFSREESLISLGKRHPFTIRYRTAAEKGGKILAAEIDLTSDAGAYPTLSQHVLLYATVAACGPYKIDNLKVDSRTVATNNQPNDAFRGFGTMQACFAHESQMDEVATALKMDLLELRRHNFIQRGEPNATGQTIDSEVWSARCLEAAWQALGGGERRGNGAVRIGRGTACYQQSYGRMSWFKDTCEAWVGIGSTEPSSCVRP